MPAPYFFYKYNVLYPEIYQSQLMQKFVQGKFLERGEVLNFFMRAQIISFDPIGGMLENQSGDGSIRSRNPDNGGYYSIAARIGPRNPSRSLRARIVSQHLDANAADSDLRIYWPLLPPIGSDPVPLEFVYVFFDENKQHGLWVSRVPNSEVDQLNFAPGDQPYKDAAQNNDGKQSKAAYFGDAPIPEINYTDQESIAGNDSDAASKKNLEYI